MTVFTIRVIYKSGHAMEFNCTKFEMNSGPTGLRNYSWTPFGDCKPLMIGADEIAAVWQLKHYESEDENDIIE